MTPSFSREFLLTAACAIWPPSEDRTESIRQTATGSLDWDYFLRVVTRHRTCGLAYESLTRARVLMPPDIAREIRSQARALLQQNLAFAAEALRLQQLFTEAGISVVILKGVPLSLLAFGNLTLRHNGDLDLLVTAESIPTADILLERAGYRRFQPLAETTAAPLQMWMRRCKEYRYFHSDKKINVELHYRLFDNPRLMSITSITGPLRVVPVAGQIGVSTFGEEDLFAYLCAHGAVHCWFRLKWLADIGAILAQQPYGGVERLYQAADARGVGRCAAQAILLCQRLLGMALPDQLTSTLSRDASVRWLEKIAISALTADLEPTEQTLGTMRNNLSLILLRREWRYWLAELENHLISPVDILTCPLSPRLRYLYPLLRLPLWFWRRRTTL